MSGVVFLSDSTRFGGETGAGLMRNRCAFTSKDMSAEWDSAFAYGIIFGWADEPDELNDPDEPDQSSALDEIASQYGWDAELIAFVRDAHERFAHLADKKAVTSDDCA